MENILEKKEKALQITRMRHHATYDDYNNNELIVRMETEYGEIQRWVEEMYFEGVEDNKMKTRFKNRKNGRFGEDKHDLLVFNDWPDVENVIRITDLPKMVSDINWLLHHDSDYAPCIGFFRKFLIGYLEEVRKDEKNFTKAYYEYALEALKKLKGEEG